MTKYARPISLEGSGKATVTTHELPIDNWASFKKENLLDGNMSKFMSLTKNNPKQGSIPRFIEITLTQPAYACAIGLRSANDFPHLDPSRITIRCTTADGKRRRDVAKHEAIRFSRRSEIRYFMKDFPDEEIDKIRIDIEDTKGGQYEFQLSQVLVYEKIRSAEF